MSQRFYLNWPLAVGPVLVTGREAHHMAGVCRVRPGDVVCLFNGDGRQYPARVTAVERRQVELEVQAVEAPERELPVRLELAAPLPRGDRAQFLIEKLTELGAACYVPLRTRRSVVAPREAKRERMERWVIEASKQCGRNVLMQVAALTDWSEYCRRPDLPAVRLLADVGGAPAGSAVAAGSALVVAVGPEGGWAEEEIAAASGWRRISLGARTLRIETAALALAALAAAGR
jgi:16S rRNA (uracil1498-N3)-methyltransferase